MDLLINLKEQNSWIKDRFSNKDLITLEELMGDYEDLILELNKLGFLYNLQETFMNDKINKKII